MQLLSGQRFKVASFGPAAGYAGWLLRSFGAEVIHESALDPEGLGAFLAEGGTFSASPGITTEAGVPLITDAPVTAVNKERLADVAKLAPVTWVTPWGVGDPEWEARPATGLLLQAAGGWMSAVGEPGEEPIGPPGDQSMFVAGLWTAVHALAAREQGLSVVSMAEAVAATCIYESVGFQALGRVRQRCGHRFNTAQCTLVTMPAADGFLGIHAALHHQWIELCGLIGQPELTKDPRFAALADRMQHLPELDEILEAWARGRPRWEAYHALQGVGIPSAAMPGLDEVLASPQLSARGAWRDVRTPSGSTYRVPGPPARIIEEPQDAPARERGAGPWREGALRVVDLSMGWAGPLVSHVMACYGADVIKLESHRRFDWWRGSRPPGDDPSLALHERSHVFNSVNRGKRGLTLDLVTPEGNRLGRELLMSADVVIENFRAGVLEKLGLDYASLARENPGLVMLRQPGFGSTGPESGYRVFGNTIEAMSGLSSMVGYEPDGRPYMMSNALGDPVSGLNGVFAVFAALEAREKTGRGCCIEGAQIEGFLPLISGELIEMQRSGVVPRPRGNARAGHAVSGLFRAAGEDDWVAIDVCDEAQGRALAVLAGATQLDDVRAWVAARDRDEAVRELAAAGIPCAPLHSEADLLQWGALAASEFFSGCEREQVGFLLYPSMPVVAEYGRPQPGLAAPLLGEHNAEILGALGLGVGDVEGLRAAGVIGEVPA